LLWGFAVRENEILIDLALFDDLYASEREKAHVLF